MKKETNKFNSKELRKIPFKNYIYLFLLLVLLVGIVFYLCEWYRVNREYQLNIPIIEGHLFEVKPNELNSYILENKDTVLYICVSATNECRNFETKLIKYIDKNSISDKIIYHNISDVNDKSNYIDTINNNYSLDKKLVRYPAFLIFNEGKIDSVFQIDKNGKISINDLDKFLRQNGVIGEDD